MEGGKTALSPEYQRKYFHEGRTPIWVEYHIDQFLSDWKGKYFFESDETHPHFEENVGHYEIKRKKAVDEEARKLDKFCEILCDTDESHREVEKEIYDVDPEFYPKPKEKKTRRKPQKQAKELPKGQDPATHAPLQENQNQGVCGSFYLEKELSAGRKENLLAKGYKRLKISPFGDSGAAYYWVETRYNESKEHAFFCFLIEAELKKLGIVPTMNVNNGPDLVFEYGNGRCCFDVETGKNLKKHPEFVQYKFSRYGREYQTNFIFVTKKEMKYPYSKFGTVVTRSTLRDILFRFGPNPDK